MALPSISSRHFRTTRLKIEGEVLLLWSSVYAERYAPSSCGSQIYSHYGMILYYLYPGSFDEPGLFQPTCGLKRREPWLKVFDSVMHRYEENRPNGRNES